MIRANPHFFSLPFETGSLKLTLETLNKYSDFRITNFPSLLIKLRHISFWNEILMLGIRLNEGNEEEIYISVSHSNLLVRCSINTNHNYLSRYAYFALFQLMSSRRSYDFEKFYWPDFFTSKNGKSKYLTITNDGNGLKIGFKPKYSFFLKPYNNIASFDLGNNAASIILKSILQKSEKLEIKPYSSSNDISKVCFLWKDKGEYYELLYRIKIGEKIKVPSKKNIEFFIKNKIDPRKSYISNTFLDYYNTLFFADKKFKIFILKQHYERYFKFFVNELSKTYEFIKK